MRALYVCMDVCNMDGVHVHAFVRTYVCIYCGVYVCTNVRMNCMPVYRSMKLSLKDTSLARRSRLACVPNDKNVTKKATPVCTTKKMQPAFPHSTDIPNSRIQHTGRTGAQMAEDL